MLIIDSLLSGLILGGLYALLAMGLTLQYGVARIMNLAYGEVLIGAAFAAYLLSTNLSVNPVAALALVLPAALLFSWLIYRIMLTPLVRRAKSRGALEVDSILTTFGLLFILQGLFFVVFGGQYYSYSYLSVPLDLFGITIAANRLVAFGVAAVLATTLYLLLICTRQGRAIRALAADPQAAQLVGVNVRKLAAWAFALGGALCAAAGVLSSMFLTFNAGMGVLFTMKALIIVIMGGVGNVMGALVAGLMLGVVEVFVARFVDPGLTLAANYALFLAVLLLRPTGLFGRPVR